MHLLAIAVSIVLAGEPVTLTPEVRFTEKQISMTAPAIREGFVRWAGTRQGQRILRHLAERRCEVHVVEDAGEIGMGRAPQPGIATLVKMSDDSATKQFTLILNPTPREIPKTMTPLPNQPANSADYMAAAWAAEMLHIYFYSKSIPLPHHQRSDFRQDWSIVAAELGFPAMEHTEDETPMQSDVVVIGGRRRR
ncbi:MAG TPA: hypothetical protein VGF48_15425 [Thermoanaerobaculia bacterium]|jgi:hypothetical protein